MEDEKEELQEELETQGSEQVRQETSEPEPARTKVGFPQGKRSTPKPGKKIFFIILVILLLGAGGYFLFARQRNTQEISTEATPTTFINQTSSTPTEQAVNRQEIKIQVLNGTGIGGAASSLKSQLEKLGYSQITVGNADKQTFTKTEVTFDDALGSSIKNEILDKLEEIYEDVDSETKSLSDFNIQIITGYPKGHTPTPSPKPTATKTPTPTATASATPTSSPTPTP